MTLIESRARRASFLSTVVRELDLEGVHVENARLDSMIASRPERFDAVVMRCAGDISSLLQRAAGLLNPGGAVIAAGPPVRRALSVGDWVEVPRRDRNPRLFAVYRPGKPG
jgi:16S rRNA G527 N7-methylase RsmG